MLKRIVCCFVIIFSKIIFADPNLDYGHFIFMDPSSGPRDIIYAKVNGYGIVEGDIILKKLNNAPNSSHTMPQAVIVAKLGGGRWQKREMPFKLADDFTPECQYAILAAISAWESQTTVKFIELNAENSLQYSDYVNFVPSYNKTNSSYVGRQGGAQEITISSSCRVMSIAHEIGHALGLWHEQSRADRDQYIKIIWENIKNEHIYNFAQHVSDGEDIGEYDYNSVMHYSAYAFSKNGARTIVPLLENTQIGQRQYLSQKDIAAINYMYADKP